MKKTRLILGLLTGSMAFFACGEDDDHDHEDEGVAVEICEHMGEGPANDAADGDDVSAEHTRQDVTLAPGDSTFTYESDDAADRLVAIYTEGAEPDFDASADGTSIILTSESLSEFDCDMTAVYRVPMDVGTVTLTLTNNDAADVDVSIVIEEDHGEEDHDHEEEE